MNYFHLWKISHSKIIQWTEQANDHKHCRNSMPRMGRESGSDSSSVYVFFFVYVCWNDRAWQLIVCILDSLTAWTALPIIFRLCADMSYPYKHIHHVTSPPPFQCLLKTSSVTSIYSYQKTDQRTKQQKKISFMRNATKWNRSHHKCNIRRWLMVRTLNVT